MLTPEKLISHIKNQMGLSLSWDTTKKDYLYSENDLLHSAYLRLSTYLGTPEDTQFMMALERVVKDLAIRQYKQKLAVAPNPEPELSLQCTPDDTQDEDYLRNLETLSNYLDQIGVNKMIKGLLPRIRRL